MDKGNKILALLLWCLWLVPAMLGCNTKPEHQHEVAHHTVYTCTMHPQIIRDAPGKCPICGMDLVKKEEHASTIGGIQLNDLVKPTNEFVVSKVAVTTVQTGSVSAKQAVLGHIAYDTRAIGTISSRVSGRIEKLYVRYRYQRISAGQRIMDVYSPELLTYQQNLLFLLQTDPNNASLINATKERLLLNGMSSQQLSALIKTRKPSNSIAIYSSYAGHIHEAAGETMGMQPADGMKDVSVITEALTIKEGSYVEKGKPVFEVYNPDRVWALLQLYSDQQGIVKKGDKVIVVPETMPDKQIDGHIDFIEPFFRQDQKTIAARVYFNNAKLQIPIGSQVKATISGGGKVMDLLPVNAVVTLGRDNVVFKKQDGGFIAKRVVTGASGEGRVQILSGLTPTDTVAADGQFLMDSESFIKAKE